MNKRQRKKSGLVPRPSRSSRRSFNKKLRYAQHYIEFAVDLAILNMTVQECRAQDLSKVSKAAEEAARNIIPIRNPWRGGALPIIRIVREIPGQVRKASVCLRVGF